VISPKTDKAYPRKSKVYTGTIDINSATYENWLDLPGVGPATASKITRFREKLGGFTAVDQIGETYGLQDSVFQKIRNHLVIKKSIRKININAVTVDALAAHPYCRYHFAKLIINYRDMHRGIKNETEMQKIYGIKEILPKLLPYLTFTP
jgi:competence ComEA-like helix-hairpin-helix protein